MRNLTPFSLSVFVFALACERTSSKRLAWKVDMLTDRKTDCHLRVRASFSPEILRAGAVKGLKNNCGLLWCVRRRQSMQVFVFPSVKSSGFAAAITNSRAAFFFFFFGLFFLLFFHTAFRLLKRGKPRLGRPDSPICASRMPSFSVLSPFRRFNVIRGAVCSTCVWARWISI